MALNAIKRRAEIEYLKLMAVVNAIISVGNHVSAAVTKGDAGGSDALNKTLDTLRELMFPSIKEEQDLKAKKAKELLAKEMAGGPIKVQVVGKKRHGR